ncbi:hypothetical protein PR202_gb01074 [Eleusine coracana subsp. coracana]|uniref:Uncharacterized protein n=1 Tax=Eleusine coracana subsp. coracana TaxID=191504 RepID=A0AAV5DVD8_ELECO|nr:hypothetical protein PR202_gb01074 [Eleusine coracana subsp. coracana]
MVQIDDKAVEIGQGGRNTHNANAKEVKHAFRNLLHHRNRPQLVVPLLLQVALTSYFITKKAVPSAESSRTVRGLGKGFSGRPYPRLCNAGRPRLEPGTCWLQATFQQVAGINVIMFYAPVLFTILGFKTDVSL